MSRSQRLILRAVLAAVACAVVVGAHLRRARIRERLLSPPMVGLELPPGVSGAGRVLHLATVGELTVSADADVVPPEPPPVGPAPYVLKISRGWLCAHLRRRDPDREGSVVLEAPDLKVTAIGTRFCVQTGTAAGTKLSVSEGRVRADGPKGGTAFLSASQSVSSTAPLFASPAVSP